MANNRQVIAQEIYQIHLELVSAQRENEYLKTIRVDEAYLEVIKKKQEEANALHFEKMINNHLFQHFKEIKINYTSQANTQKLQDDQLATDLLFNLAKAFYNKNKIDKHGHSLLHWVILLKQPSATIQPLINDINDTNQLNLLIPLIAEYSQISVLESIADKCATFFANNEKVMPLLLTALKNKNSQLVAFLINKNRSIMSEYKYNKEGDTPLITALKNNDYPSVNILLEAGADIHHQNIAGDTALLIATKLDLSHQYYLKPLLEKGAQIDQPNFEGASSLFIAAMHGNLATVIYLVENGANINFVKEAPYERTVLKVAAERKHDKIVNYLLDKNAQYSVKDFKGASAETLLIALARKGDLLSVKTLIENGTNINCMTADNMTPLFAAALNSHIVIVKYLLSSGCDEKINEQTHYMPSDYELTHYGAQGKDNFSNRILKFSSFNSLNLNTQFFEFYENNRLLFNENQELACFVYNISIAWLLSAMYAQKSNYLDIFHPITLSMQAIQDQLIKDIFEYPNTHFSTHLKRFLKDNPFIDKRFIPILEKMEIGARLFCGEPEFVLLLSQLRALQRPANVYSAGLAYETLIRNNLYNYLKVLNFKQEKNDLLFANACYYFQKNAFIDFLTNKDPMGYTLLHCAILFKQSVDTIKKYATAIDNFEQLNFLLIFAIKYNRLDVVKYLQEQGANINYTDPNTNETPLITAARNGQLETVKYLIEKGANPNQVSTHNDNNDKSYQSVFDDSALISAAKNGHLQVVEYLVEKGANIAYATHKNETALNVAATYTYFEMANFLHTNTKNSTLYYVNYEKNSLPCSPFENAIFECREVKIASTCFKIKMPSLEDCKLDRDVSCLIYNRAIMKAFEMLCSESKANQKTISAIDHLLEHLNKEAYTHPQISLDNWKEKNPYYFGLIENCNCNLSSPKLHQPAKSELLKIFELFYEGAEKWCGKIRLNYVATLV